MQSSSMIRAVLTCVLALAGSCTSDPVPTDDTRDPAQGSDDADGSDEDSGGDDASSGDGDGDDATPDDGSEPDMDAGGGDGDGDDGEPGSTIVLDTSASGADVSSDVAAFPVAIVLTADNFDFSSAAADGSDVRFRDASGAMLAHEIEYWDAGEQQAALWVRVDVKGNAAEQRIRMTTGESGEGGSDGKSVFSTDDGWVGVWHLSDADGYSDTTANAQHGTGRNISGGANAEGRIGRAVDLEHDEKQYIRIEGSERNELYQLDDNATYSIWVKAESHEVDYQCMFSKGENGFRIHYYGSASWGTNMGKHITEPCLDPGDRCPLKGGNDQPWMGVDVKPDEWFHLAFVVRERAIEYYVNGVLEVEEGPGNVSSGFEILSIGNNADRNRSFDGVLDEARIHGEARSADWVKLEYENQRAGGKLVTILR
jgi:hypothetical protein